jgi:hypothetical protein
VREDFLGFGDYELTNTGWWFGTFFIFPCIGNNNPNRLIFFRGVKPPTSIFIYLFNSLIVYLYGELSIATCYYRRVYHAYKSAFSATLFQLQANREHSSLVTGLVKGI